MSEMLGNYHFLIRDYYSALGELENALDKDPGNKLIRKKLIICMTQAGKVEEAFDHFYSLINEDIGIIINTKPDWEDCPCPHLVNKIEKDEIPVKNQYEKYLQLGMLWLYCDAKESIKNFKNALKYRSDEKILHVIKLIEPYNKHNN
ncbi:tetratricopeptide repeat protein [Melioribacter sp. OK-6-Me]|uniref:tetratricopeptide repeat protein n=1 Tax=unclassified Melioribacter TaxID=2627329 RepID=UPI003EDA0A04